MAVGSRTSLRAQLLGTSTVFFLKKTNLTNVTSNTGTAKYGFVPMTQKEFVRQIQVNEAVCVHVYAYKYV